jgi:superfamily I DNA/RNA helicase
MPLPKPVGRQKEVLYLPRQGNVVVLGTAGSGKTTLAILRSAYLAESLGDSAQKVLLVTFNNALVTYLESLKPAGWYGVDVRTYHRFARGYLSRRGLMGFNSIVKPDRRESLIQQAVREERSVVGDDPLLARPLGMFSDEFAWIAKSGIRTEAEYTSVERVGRAGTRIVKRDRTLLFRVYVRYLQLRSMAGYNYDWDDVALAVADAFRQDVGARMYRHIVIDEGQDFSPAMLRSLAAALPSGGSMTFFGDVAQQIYGTRISWRSAGLEHPEIWTFKENYRNSRQIARLGLAISRMPYFQGTADIVEPREPKADGPLPTMVRCKTVAAETHFALEQAERQSGTRTVAILMRNRDREEHYLSVLEKASVPARRLHADMRAWTPSPGVFVGTYHAAKGLEFDTVILPYCSDNVLPDPSRVEALSLDEAMAEEGRLLYVAVTRAKSSLIITHSAAVSPLLPVDGELYQRVTE